MNRVEIYNKRWCHYCARAKADLQRKLVAYEEIRMTAE